MTLQINRDLALPLYTQIVGQLQFDIVTGRLPAGLQLPSIRELAQELAVAPMTITQAYQELRQLGLIEMRPGLGTFVASPDTRLDEMPAPSGPLQLRRILQRAVVEAQHEGFGDDEIKGTFLSLLTNVDGLFGGHRFVLVGLFPSALRVYADDLERWLAAEQVTVEPISFADLQTRLDYYRPRLFQAEALLVPLHQVQMLRDLIRANLPDWRRPILGVSFVLRSSAQTAIAALPPALRIGIVSRFAEFVNTMVGGIAAVHPLEQEPVICLSEDEGCLRRLAESVEAVVYATGAEEAAETLRLLLPPGVPLIEYLHTPDESICGRIRQLIAHHQVAPVEVEPSRPEAV